MKKIKALGEWIFIKRDKQDKTFLGLEISEKALTKNLKGVITHSVDNQKIGMRIHLPHYRVLDCTVGDDEYAIIKEGDLFAIEDGDSFRPVNKYVKVRKCENDHIRDDSGKVVLYNTDRKIEETNWVEILDVAEDCDNIKREDIGMFCIAPERSDGLRRLLYSKDYCLKEDEIEFITGD